MSVRHFKQYLTIAASALAIFFSAAVVPAAEWYWINDFGGTWDEEAGGVASWRDPADDPGIPSALDDALLVLPYSFSFCNPDGSCFTQPVVVLYRSETGPTLDELIIESRNTLLQQEGIGVSLDQLNLTSNMEIVGGSGRTFSPPPSFPLPEPPGIFPDGVHTQRAGTNTVNLNLTVGRASGSIGRYELSDTGVLDVGLFEVIGDAGEGHFSQTGGTNTAASVILGGQVGGSGNFVLEGGNLETSLGVIGDFGSGAWRQTGGTFAADEARIGVEAGSTGSYVLEGGSIEAGSVVVGTLGDGEFIHQSGEATISSDLVLGHAEGGIGRYELRGGELTVLGHTTLGESGEGSFIQSGADSLHRVASLRMGYTPGGVGSYELHDGRLHTGSTTVGGGDPRLPGPATASFTQHGGEHDVDHFVVGSDFETGRAGQYALLGGETRAISLEVRGMGTFEQFGGVLGVAEALYVLFGQYTLHDGRLEVGSVALPIAEVTIRGTFEQVGASSEVFIYGNAAATGDDLSPATYTMTDGSLHVSNDLVIGRYDPATFTQHNGEVNLARLTLGLHGTPVISRGLYDMRGGNLVVGERMTVGSEGEGDVHQVGGVVHVRGDLVVAESRRSRYLLEDTGQLQVDGTLTIGSEHGIFDLRGGRLTVNSLSNGGQFTWEGGDLVPGTISSEGTFAIDLPGPRTVHASVVLNHGDFNFMSSLTLVSLFHNYGTVKLFDGVEVTFAGSFANSGRLESDPALARFTGDLSVLAEGHLVGGAGDRFIVEGDFLNSSEQADLWDTAAAALILGGSGRQTVELPGEDRGYSPAGRIDNFAWGTLEIPEGVEVEFTDGNASNNGTAIYVGVLDIQDRTLIDPENLLALPFFGDADIYYDPSLPENDYLDGLTYAFADGTGTLTAQIPEPATIWLIIAVLSFARPAIRRCPVKPTVT